MSLFVTNFFLNSDFHMVRFWVNGGFEPVIAGESADFEFTLDCLFCEQYGIEVGN